VLKLMGIVMSIGLADSLNPTTIAPALYLAAGERPRRRVTEFTLAVFVVFLIGGAVIALGPGQLLLSLVPHPDAEDRAVLEVIAGVAMIAAGLLLWRHRDRFSQSEDKPPKRSEGKPGWLLGATISAIELPTAFPYFAAIAAIVGSGVGLPQQLLLLVLFNICFVLPLIAIIVTLWLAGDNAAPILARGRELLQRHWPTVLSVAAVAAGVIAIVFGATGLAARSRGRLGRVARRVEHLLPGG
jgi:cytochrome c biogenesis protein CcdA